MMRKQFAGFVASALALAVSGQVFAGTVTTDGADLYIKTKGGFEVGTTDKEFSFKLGGRIQADYNSFDGIYTKNGKTADEAFFRRAILELSGTASKDWKYAFNVDFGDSGASKWDEASVTYTGFKPLNVKIGRFDPDFGLEKATSSKWITAIERSAIYDLADWVNDKQNGMAVQVSGVAADLVYGSASINRAKGNEDENGANNNTYNLRAVIAPMAKAGNVLHFGVNYAQRDMEETDVQIRSRLGARGVTEGNGVNGARVFDTGKATYDGDSVLGLEAAFAAGPFSIQGEYLKRDLEAITGGEDLEATGYNVQVAYTLTGESRGYKLDGGKFDSIKPANKQMGAWEAFYRYDNVNAEAGLDEIDGKVHTLGVNWYANEAVKVSANYMIASTENAENTVGDDDGNAIAMRLQYAF